MGISFLYVIRHNLDIFLRSQRVGGWTLVVGFTRLVAFAHIDLLEGGHKSLHVGYPSEQFSRVIIWILRGVGRVLEELVGLFLFHVLQTAMWLLHGGEAT